MSGFRLSVLLPLLALAFACGGSSAPPKPVAQAGPDQTVASGAVVTLDGSASSDPSGLPLTYQWAPPQSVTLSSATAARPTFTAPAMLAGQQPITLAFTLTVSSANGTSGPATATVTVNAPRPANPPPVASAGPNQSVASAAAVTLTGSGSDPDGQTITAFSWTQTSGTPQVTLSGAGTAQASFTAPTVASPVTLVFSLVVSDASASSTPSTVAVVVNPASSTCQSGLPPPAPPGTPPPATDPNPPPVGGNGNNRFEMGTDLSSGGLTVVDPAAGEPTVQGFVVVSFNRGPAPADAVVTVNGVRLTRVTSAGASGLFWQLDPPPAPQPIVGSGGELVLVATATDPTGKQVQRTLALPCPSDIPVTLTPALGSPLVPSTPVNLTSTSNILLNLGVPLFSPYGPKITMRGYDPCTRTLGDGVSLTGVTTANGFNVDVPVLATTSRAYLLDLRWPGPGFLDGQTGGYCQLAKRFFFTK